MDLALPEHKCIAEFFWHCCIDFFSLSENERRGPRHINGLRLFHFHRARCEIGTYCPCQQRGRAASCPEVKNFGNT